MVITATPHGRLGRWLLDRFDERGWDSYRQAATYTGISHTQLRNYVQSGVTPRPWVLQRLAEKFDRPRAELDALTQPEVFERRGNAELVTDPGTIARLVQRVEELLAVAQGGRIGAGYADNDPATLPPFPIEGLADADRARLFHVPVTDNALAPRVRPGALVWIDPLLAPAPGKIVLAEVGGVRRLKVYEEGDVVVGVGRLAQTIL